MWNEESGVNNGLSIRVRRLVKMTRLVHDVIDAFDCPSAATVITHWNREEQNNNSERRIIVN